MMESMGIVASQKAVLEMIREVDTDGNDEIDFDELCTIASKNSGQAKGAKGISFASVFERKKNSGPPQLWRDDKTGVGMAVGAGKREVTHTGEAFGVQLVDMWLSTAGFDRASVILSLDELSGECYIGVASVNMNAREWDCSLGQSSKGMAPWATVECSTGKTFCKGQEIENMKLCKIQQGDRFAFDISMRDVRMTCTVLRKDPKAATDPPTWVGISEVQIENIHNEVAVAVSFGQTKGTSKIRIVGSSCEKTPKPGASATQKSEAEQRGNIVMDDTTKMALSLQM